MTLPPSNNHTNEYTERTTLNVRNQIIAGSAWVLFGRVSGALVGIVFYSLLTRLLPPADVGTYFIAFSIATVIATVAGLGLPRTSTRLLAEATSGNTPGTIRSMVLRSVGLILAAGMLLSAIYVALLGEWLAKTLFSNPQLAPLSGYISAWFILLALRQLLAESFRGLGNIKLASLFGGLVSSSITTALLAGGLLALNEIVIDRVMVFTLSGLLISTGLAIYLFSRGITTKPGDGDIRLGQILAISGPIMLTEIMQVILAQSNTWILGGISTETQVALYGTVLQIVLLVSFPFVVVNNAIPQLLVRFKVAGQQDKLERLLQGVATATFFPALLLVVGLFLLGRPLLELVYGQSYGDGASALLWLAVGQLVNVITGPCGIALILTGHQNISLAVTTITGFLTIPLAFVLSARYGATGAAASAAIAMAAQNIALVVLAKRKVGVRTHVSFSRRIMSQFTLRARA